LVFVGVEFVQYFTHTGGDLVGLKGTKPSSFSSEPQAELIFGYLVSFGCLHAVENYSAIFFSVKLSLVINKL